jgi:hypothetical protein
MDSRQARRQLRNAASLDDWYSELRFSKLTVPLELSLPKKFLLGKNDSKILI